MTVCSHLLEEDAPTSHDEQAFFCLNHHLIKNQHLQALEKMKCLLCPWKCSKLYSKCFAHACSWTAFLLPSPYLLSSPHLLLSRRKDCISKEMLSLELCSESAGRKRERMPHGSLPATLALPTLPVWHPNLSIFVLIKGITNTSHILTLTVIQSNMVHKCASLKKGHQLLYSAMMHQSSLHIWNAANFYWWPKGKVT